MEIRGTIPYDRFWDFLEDNKRDLPMDTTEETKRSLLRGNSNDHALPIDRPTKRQKTAKHAQSIIKKIPVCKITLPLELHCTEISSEIRRDRSLPGLISTWTCLTSDTGVQQAKLSVGTSDGITLLCNETVRLDGEDIAQEDINDIFFAIADACQSGIAETGDAYLRWSSETCFVELSLSLISNRLHTKKTFHLMNKLYPCCEPEPASDTVEDFFRNLRPMLSYAASKLSHFTIDNFASNLVPFQAQNVEWMLQKENHRINSDNDQIEPVPEEHAQDAYIWEKFNCESGQLYINRVTEKVELEMTDELKEAANSARRGGVLADEMGLGKTVCAIALICLHRLNQTSSGHPTPEMAKKYNLKHSGATLIITPPAIIKQWEAELRQHAPNLRVKIYDGVKRDKEMQTETMVEELAGCDVVLTDYTVLKEEVYFARPQPDRSRRFERKYPPKRSPLVQILWFRGILDEAQMVESPMALVGEMAQLIPRWFSWAITGTPIKHDIDDLYGVYLFLGLAPCISNHAMFKKMITKPHLKGIFYKFARETIKRNTKAELADQIHIPAQNRFIVHVDFSTVEQQYYQNLWERCLSTSANSFLENRDWNLEMCADADERREFQTCVARLKSWLLTLRQACVHPAVGTSSKRGGVVGQSVRTLDEVLDALINQCKDEVDNSMSRLVNAQLLHGGMLELLKDPEGAIKMYKAALENAKSSLDNNEARIVKIQATGDKGGGNEDSKANDAKEDRMQNLVKRRHKWLSYLHRCYFYLGCVYSGLEKPDEEKMYYDEAASTRLRILNRAEDRVNRGREEALKQNDDFLDDAVIEPVAQPATILFSTYIRERIEDLTETLNKQLGYIKEWRSSLRDMLRTDLVDHNGEEATGNEYQESLEIQEKLALYQDVYQAILRDRGFYLNGIWLASTSNTKEASYLSSSNEDGNQRNEQETAESDEILALRLKLNKLRREISPNAGSDNLPAIIATLRNAITKAEDNPYEKQIIRSELFRLQHLATKQRSLQEHLEAEYRKLNALYNHRIEYYRALQELSDHVREWESPNPENTILKCKREEQEYQSRFKEQSARCSYLENLTQQDWDTQQNCLICRSDFSQGAVTPCGHMYCRDCAVLWFRQHHRCPQCNTHVQIRECYLIAWSKSSKNDEQESNKKGYMKAPMDREAPADYMEVVRQAPVVRGLGAKLDGIIQHIKHIKETSNGKCVVFSQWSEVLGLLATGLEKNQIGFVHFGKSRREDSVVKFREDPAINVILLHARSHSSGLTLTAAQTVFIVEPVLNDALERQAISRVHRIGQTRETTVYWYIVRNTVEERIHAIHNRRQLSKAEKMKTDEVEVEAPEDTPLESQKHGGGEFVTEQDLRECFA